MRKLIPGTDGFVASFCGRIFDQNGVERTYYRNGDGYVTASVSRNGEWSTFGVHRLVAMAHVPGRTTERDHVNHIDGNVENNSAPNVDWVTVKENNLHAAILNGSKVKPILVAHSPAGEYSFMYTKEEACEAIGCTFPELWYSIKEKRMIDGWTVRYNEGPIPISLQVKLTPHLYEKTAVKMLNLETQEVLDFESMMAAAKFLGTTASLITQTLTTTDQIRLCMKKYIVVKAECDFPDVSPEEFQRLKDRHGRSVIVGNVDSGEISIYQKAVDFYGSLGLSKKAVTTALRVDRLREIGGYVFLYVNDSNVERIKTYIKNVGDYMSPSGVSV